MPTSWSAESKWKIVTDVVTPPQLFLDLFFFCLCSVFVLNGGRKKCIRPMTFRSQSIKVCINCCMVQISPIWPYQWLTIPSMLRKLICFTTWFHRAGSRDWLLSILRALTTTRVKSIQTFNETYSLWKNCQDWRLISDGRVLWPWIVKIKTFDDSSQLISSIIRKIVILEKGLTLSYIYKQSENKIWFSLTRKYLLWSQFVRVKEESISESFLFYWLVSYKKHSWEVKQQQH